MDKKMIFMIIVAIVLGMLSANMLKDVCGCKVVEGQSTTQGKGCPREEVYMQNLASGTPWPPDPLGRDCIPDSCTFADRRWLVNPVPPSTPISMSSDAMRGAHSNFCDKHCEKGLTHDGTLEDYTDDAHRLLGQLCHTCCRWSGPPFVIPSETTLDENGCIITQPVETYTYYTRDEAKPRSGQDHAVWSRSSHPDHLNEWTCYGVIAGRGAWDEHNVSGTSPPHNWCNTHCVDESPPHRHCQNCCLTVDDR